MFFEKSTLVMNMLYQFRLGGIEMSEITWALTPPVETLKEERKGQKELITRFGALYRKQRTLLLLENGIDTY